MAYTSKTLLLFVLVAFLLIQVFAAEAFADHGNEFDDVAGVANLAKVHRHPKINCSYACARRCKKSSRKNVCRRACGTCCFRCQCVPPGTYGNKNSCPCYAKLTTHGKRPKCP